MTSKVWLTQSPDFPAEVSDKRQMPACLARRFS